MKLSLLLLILSSFSAWSAENFKSLSCSRIDRGTQIYYINGVFSGEYGTGSAEETAEIITDYITDIGKNRIDVNSKVFIENIYNTSEPLATDIIQTILQKIKETGEVPSARKIGGLIFRNAKYCLSSPILCSSIAISVGRLLSVQSYISSSDLNTMAGLVSQHLRENYKVIVVSHSQGNIYSNMLYDRVLKFGVEPEILDKYYGNLQVASAASSIKAKNFRLFTSDQDKVINGLREKFPTTLKANYTLVGNSQTMDGVKHTMALNYLSPTIEFLGHKQGFGMVKRKAKEIFLDNLEEVAWMLANNDPKCCNGNDGRFHRNDYTSSPDGFVESSVYVDPNLNLQIENRQVCGAFEFRSFKKGDKIVISNQNQTLKASNLIILKGNIYIKGSLKNESQNPQIISNHSSVPLVARASITGDAKVEGPFYLYSADIHGPSIIKGELFVHPSDPTNTFAPIIASSRITGPSETSGNFILTNRSIHNSRIYGGVPSIGPHTWRNTFVGGNPLFIFDNVTVDGNVFVSEFGIIEAGTTLRGFQVEGNSNGIIIHENARVMANSTITGTGFVQGRYAGDWQGNIDPQGMSGYLDAQSVKAKIIGAPRISTNIIGPDINSGRVSTISGNPIIEHSNLYGCNVTCNAKVIDETRYNFDFGCGYESSEPSSIDYVANMNWMISNSFNKAKGYRDLLEPYMSEDYANFLSY